jgi:hypothetical protein
MQLYTGGDQMNEITDERVRELMLIYDSVYGDYLHSKDEKDVRDCLDDLIVIRQRIDELEGESHDMDLMFKRIMEEKCPTDEVHCTCVPLLRNRILKDIERNAELLAFVEKVSAVPLFDGQGVYVGNVEIGKVSCGQYDWIITEATRLIKEQKK